MNSLFGRKLLRRRVFNLCALAALFIIISYAFDFYPKFGDQSNRIDLLFRSSHAKVGETISFSSLEEGRWVSRSPPWTLEDMASKWNGEYKATEHLPPPPDGQSRTAEEDARAKAERAVRLVNWVWEGAGSVQELAWQDWLPKLMKSNGGLIIIGDSIQFQFFEYLRFSLPKEFHVDYKDTTVHGLFPEHPAPSIYSLSVNPNSALAEQLLRLVGHSVPVERFSRPLVSFVRSDVLIDLETLIRIRNETVTGSDWHKHVDDSYKVDSGFSNIVFGDWESWTRQLSRNYVLEKDPVTGEERSWRGSEKTILHVNTGTHWSGSTLRWVNERQTLAMYQKMVNIVYPIMKSIPMTRVIYRPTVTGHINCHTYSSPVGGLDDLVPTSFHENWAWNLFDAFNKPWHEVLDRGNPNGLGGVLPIYFRSTLRPDNHFLSGDCLHMAGPSVCIEWAAWTWKLLGELELGWR